MKNHAPWIVAALLCAGTVVHAQEPAKTDQPKHPAQPSAEEAFKKMDTNSDVQLSLDEFKAGMAERVKSHPNAKEMPAEMIEKRFKALDTDGNGTVSLEEFKKGREPRARHGDAAPKTPDVKPVTPDAAPKAPDAAPVTK